MVLTKRTKDFRTQKHFEVNDTKICEVEAINQVRIVFLVAPTCALFLSMFSMFACVLCMFLNRCLAFVLSIFGIRSPFVLVFCVVVQLILVLFVIVF